MIDNFNFEGVAGDFKLVEGVDRLGDHWRHKRKDIAEGLTLYVYDSGQAALEFKDHEAIQFLYTEEIAEMFQRLDKVKALDLMRAIGRNGL